MLSDSNLAKARKSISTLAGLDSWPWSEAQLESTFCIGGLNLLAVAEGRWKEPSSSEKGSEPSAAATSAEENWSWAGYWAVHCRDDLGVDIDRASLTRADEVRVWGQYNSWALRLMEATVSRSMRHAVRGTRTAPERLQAIRAYLRTKISPVELHRRFRGLRQRGRSLGEYEGELGRLCSLFDLVGEPKPSPAEREHPFLRGLDERFAAARRAILTENDMRTVLRIASGGKDPRWEETHEDRFTRITNHLWVYQERLKFESERARGWQAKAGGKQTRRLN